MQVEGEGIHHQCRLRGVETTILGNGELIEQFKCTWLNPIYVRKKVNISKGKKLSRVWLNTGSGPLHLGFELIISNQRPL